MSHTLRFQFLEHVGQTSPNPLMIEVDHAQGSFYFTPEGKKYYDLVAGVSVNNVGHGNPEVIAAVQEQVKRYMHIMVYGENPALGYITTFGGHPVCCAAGLAALNFLLKHHFMESVEEKGQLFEMLLQHQPHVIEIRRNGLLMAVESGSSEKLFKVMTVFKEVGIMSDWFLFCDTAFRISPPLTISMEEIRDCGNLIGQSLR